MTGDPQGESECSFNIISFLLVQPNLGDVSGNISNYDLFKYSLKMNNSSVPKS